MKNSILSIFCLFAVVVILLTVCGCTHSNESQKSAEDFQIYTNSEQSIQSGNSNSNKLRITSAEDFSDGFAWIKVYTKELSDDKVTLDIDHQRSALIDLNGNIQFYLDEKITNIGTKNPNGYKSGICSVEDDNENQYILDTNGKIILSSEKDGFSTILDYGDGYIAVENCINDLHSIKYTVSIYDKEGKIIKNEWLASDNTFRSVSYCGEGVFKCSDLNQNEEFFNAKASKSFSLENPYKLYDNYSGGLCIVKSKDSWTNPTYKLMDNGGNQTEINLNGNLVLHRDNWLVFQDDNDLILYDTLSGKDRVLYNSGNNISATIVGYENGMFLISIKQEDVQNKFWFTLLDTNGKEEFAPIEGSASAFSCDRIVCSNEGVYSKPFLVYDSKGNKISVPENYYIVMGRSSVFNDNMLAVTNSLNFSINATVNYVDVNGKLMFENDKIDNQRAKDE